MRIYKKNCFFHGFSMLLLGLAFWMKKTTLLLLALAVKLHFYQGDRKVSPTKTISSRGGAASITTIFLVAQIQDFGLGRKIQADSGLVDQLI